LVERKPS